MANIQSNLNKIKNAVLGVDVRDSIHDGIKAINEEVENTTDRQVQLEGTFDELVINAGNSNAEVAAARVDSTGKSHGTLGKRLNNFDSQIKEKASKLELEVERKRIDLLTKIESGQIEGNTELLDIRISSDGTEYNTAGDAVRGQFTKTNAEVSNIIKGVETNELEHYVLFENGGIDENGDDNSDFSNIRIRTKLLKFNKDITLKCSTGYKFMIYIYNDNNNFLAKSLWETNTTVVKNRNIRIVLGKQDDSNINPSESCNIIISSLLENKEIIDARISLDGEEHKTIGQHIRDITKSLKEGINYDVPNLSFEQGSLIGNSLTDSENRLRSVDYLDISKYRKYTINVKDGYKAFIRGFDESYIPTTSHENGYLNWRKGNINLGVLHNDVKFIKILFAKDDDSTISIDDATNNISINPVVNAYDLVYLNDKGQVKKVKDIENNSTLLKYKNNKFSTSLNENLEIVANRESLDNFLKDRVLIWEDDFDGNELDKNKWESLFGYYNANRYYMYKDVSKNAYCEDSCLVLKNIKDFPNEKCSWSGAFVRTKNKFEFRYGRVEAKIKFPSSNIYHSTFWTLGANYDRVCDENTTGDETLGVLPSTCGEFDIAECDNRFVSNNIHYSSDEINTHVQAGGNSYDVDPSQWHIYAMEWTENNVQFYVDNILKRTWDINNATVNNYNPFKLPHFLMFNSNPGLSETNTNDDEIITLCDWVRVYAPNDVKEYIYETGIEFDVNNVTLNVGDVKLLTTTFTPDNASDKTLVWESYNEKVAKCHGGKITAIGTGTTFIRATSKHGYRKMCKVVVN